MSFGKKDLERLAEILKLTAEQEIMPRFRRLGEGGIREKASALDLVTDADEAAEAAIKVAVARVFPNSLFIGEESVARDPSLLEKIAGAELAIIIDPLDGTTNFAWGMPLFGMLAAVVIRGETIGGIIYEPINRDFTFAIKSLGAWNRSDSGVIRDIHVAKPKAIENMVGTTSCYLIPPPTRLLVATNLNKVKATFAYRCAAHEYRIVAEGLVDFLFHYNLMPWDHAAGALIHAEAGGYSGLFDGSPYLPTKFHGGILSAPNRESWQIIHDELLR